MTIRTGQCYQVEYAGIETAYVRKIALIPDGCEISYTIGHRLFGMRQTEPIARFYRRIKEAAAETSRAKQQAAQTRFVSAIECEEEATATSTRLKIWERQQ
jgi:hypothetical protein